MRALKEKPKRTVCLSCRTLLGEESACPNGQKHQVVDLATPRGRSRFDDEVWGDDSRARELRRLARVGAGGGVAGSVFDGCSGCEGTGNVFDACSSAEGVGGAILGAIVAVLVFIVAALIAVLLFYILKKLYEYIRYTLLDRPKPKGALRAPARARGAAQAAGKIEGTPAKDTPWGEGKCVAYAMELHKKRVFGGGAMLRDATTSGFDVVTDDGRRVRIPPGRIRVTAKLPKVDADEKKLKTLLSELDADFVEGADRQLFPYDYARALALAPGDRVEVLGDLEAIADGSAGSAYRASAGLLVPKGTPILRVTAHDAAANPSAEPKVRVDAAEAEPEPGALEEPEESERERDRRA